MTKIKKRKIKQHRHDWGPMEYHGSFEDGTYQTCETCGATRFKGERYSYGSRQ